MTLAPLPDPHHPLLDPSALVATLREFVAINSVNPAHGGPANGERRVLECAARWLGDRSIAARIEGPAGQTRLVARVEGARPGPSLLFETHVDTVSAEAMTVDPFAGEVRDDRLWGRGATDAKGQAVAMLHALATRAAASTPPPVAIELVLVSDEEFGFGGARALLADGIDARAIVIGEPTGLRVVAAHKGVARFDVRVQGRSAHASRPELGVNAIAGAALIVDLIRRRLLPDLATRSSGLLTAATLNVATIHGGRQPNLIPDACTVSLERRLLPGETADLARSEVEALFAEACAALPGLEVSLGPTTLHAGAFHTDPSGPLARAAGEAAASIGRPAEPVGVDYCTDASVLHAAGIPIVVAGPGSIEQAHTADEFIAIDELERGARFYAALMGWDGEA